MDAQFGKPMGGGSGGGGGGGGGGRPEFVRQPRVSQVRSLTSRASAHPLECSEAVCFFPFSSPLCLGIVASIGAVLNSPFISHTVGAISFPI